MSFKTIPIESIDGKPIFGMIIKPEQFNDILKEVKKDLGNDFLIAKKPTNDGRLKVTFIVTAKNPPNKAVLQKKLGKIADAFQARALSSSELEPTMLSFPPKHALKKKKTPSKPVISKNKSFDIDIF